MTSHQGNLMRDMDLHRRLLGVGAALLLALGFTSLAQAAPGDLDPSFGTGGQVITDFFGIAPSDDYATALALQADGKIVVAGYSDNGTNTDFALARYNADGSLDTTFGIGGTVTTDFGGSDKANALVLQADGKVVVAGDSDNGTNTDFALARYNADGSLDTTFGNSGMVTTDFGGSDEANALAIQTDGKIVVAGTGNYDFALARYNPDGSLDPTFGLGGTVTTDFGSMLGWDGSPDEANALALQANGKIVVGGTFYSDSSVNGLVLARYRANGLLDITFSIDGVVSLGHTSGPEYFGGLALQADGKIMLAGSCALWRFNSNGSLDTTFGTGGMVTGFSGNVAIQADSKILVASSTSYCPDVLVRYNPDGSLDTSFGSDGTVAINFSTALALQSDGKIVVAGTSSTGTNSDFALARYNPDGSLDTTFGTNGTVTTNFGVGSGSDSATDLALQADGKIVVAGDSTGSSGYTDFALARYRPGGSLDTTFGTNGTVTTDFGGDDDHAHALALQADGKIVVAGGASGDFALARYNPDGSLDTAFGIDGKVTTDFSTTYYDQANSLTLPADGKIVVAGGASGDFALARYNTDGSLDTTFGTDGKVITDFGDWDFAQDLALQADGKIVVAGFASNGSNYDFALARYSADGSLDATFGTDGKVITDFGSHEEANSLALQADGRIVMAGGASGDFALARYNPDGSLDTTFGRGGKVTGVFTSASYGYATALAMQADGKIVVAGYAYDNFALARFNADGSLDTSFGSDGRVITNFSGSYYSAAASLVLQADGKIVAAGYSWNVADSDFALARYLGDAEEAEPVLSVSPRVLIFGKVEVGTTADKSFTVQNIGGGTLTGSATTIAPFSLVEGSPFSLGEGQSQEVVARFSPSSKVFSLGTVSVSSDGGSANVSLVGKGK